MLTTVLCVLLSLKFTSFLSKLSNTLLPFLRCPAERIIVHVRAFLADKPVQHPVGLLSSVPAFFPTWTVTKGHPDLSLPVF
jgi:hypothetical protein